MQDRATSFKRPLNGLAYLFMFLCCGVVTAHADQELQLPKRVTELKVPPTDNKTTTAQTPQDLAAMKAALKFEILEELRGQKEFVWKQPAKPKLNFLELSGYFRTRADAISRCDLGTFIPKTGMGTSQCAPPTGYYPTDPNNADTGSRPSWLLSSDLRFRLDPTLNVSEDIRIKGRVDVLDNLVLGSTPAYMGGVDPNPSYPISFLPGTQNTTLLGVNSQFGPVAVKRLWAEAAFPFGEFKFGRMPLDWGLGIFFNSGDSISSDFGNNVDGVFFTTRVLGHDLTPGFSASYTGPTGRGGGLGANGDNNVRWTVAEGGYRFDLDPSDNVYNFYLSFARKDSPAETQALLDDNRNIWNYGFLGAYRFQMNDSLYTRPSDVSLYDLRKQQTLRNAHLGIGSLWSKMQFGQFHIEAEAVGLFGQIGNGTGLWSDANRADPIWIYQGGIALESRYGFLQNRLQVGVDTGWASGDPTPGFGVRPGLNKNPLRGSADGQQFADDGAISNFAFDRDYHVDLLLFREVIGTVTDALYLKPHVAYYFTDNFGLRGDVIGAMSNFARSTPGNNQILGLELDASVFFKTEDGFIFNLQYGYLFPFDGLNHDRLGAAINNDDILYANHGKALSATGLRVMAGVTF